MTQKRELVLPEFESIVSNIMQSVAKERLAELRKDFHTRLRITLNHPENSELIEDLWDFFYDWCVFEQNIPELFEALPANVQSTWTEVKGGAERGLFSVEKISDSVLKLKDLFDGKKFALPKKSPGDFIGISKGDIIEGRLVGGKDTKEDFSFVRRPSYHPTEVHDYIKKKVKEFKKTKDTQTYQAWLWLLVGMYLKHRIYQHMPIEKIYDDNSRI